MPTDSSLAAPPSAAARWTPPILWFVLIAIGTSWPRIQVGSGALPLDKIVHFAMYGVLSALVLRATLTWYRPRTFLVVLVGLVILGAVDEWHQSFIPGRSMSFGDWIADSAGAVLGAFAVRSLSFLAPARRPAS